MRAGIQEYVKRLTPFSKWEELEQNEVKMPDNCSPVMKEKILMEEGESLLFYDRRSPREWRKYTEACKSAHIIWQNDIDASDGKTDTLRADLQSHENYSQPALSFVIDNLKTKDKINCGFI